MLPDRTVTLLEKIHLSPDDKSTWICREGTSVSKYLTSKEDGPRIIIDTWETNRLESRVRLITGHSGKGTLKVIEDEIIPFTQIDELVSRLMTHSTFN